MRTLLLICCLAFQGAALHAQDQYRIFAPTKDVAMLVDVSVSVRKDAEGHEEARNIIQSIVSGEGLGRTRLKENWDIDANPEMEGLFGAYLGLPATAESAELRPLMEVNNSFLSMHIGTVETVLTQGQYRRLRKPEEIKEFVSSGYPGIKDMDDKSTCYWLGMARAAGTLSQNSKLGYYLFVVSDEEDDPDYRKEGPDGHTASDYVSYMNGLAKTYPETAIRAEIARYFDFKGTNSRRVDLYQPRGDFKQVLIAKFAHTAYRVEKSRVKIAWYAMGVVPQRVHVPRVIQPPEPVPVAAAPLEYQPPRLEASLQWLGGLEEPTRKTFNYSLPLLVWQVRNAEAAGRTEDGRPSLQIDGRSRSLKKLASSPRHVLQTAAIPNEIEDGSMNVSVRVDDLESEEAKIEVRRPTLARLQIFAWVSAILALVVFLLSWRSLRQAPAQRAKSAA